MRKKMDFFLNIHNEVELMSQMNILDFAYTDYNDSITSGLGRPADDSMTEKRLEVFERINHSYGSIYITMHHSLDDINDYIVKYTHAYLRLHGVKVLLHNREFRENTMMLFEEEVHDLRGFANFVQKQLVYEEDISFLDSLEEQRGADTEDGEEHIETYCDVVEEVDDSL